MSQQPSLDDDETRPTYSYKLDSEGNWICPVDGCSTTKPSYGSIHYHVESVHEGKKWPCAEKGCSHVSSSRRGLREHRKNAHTLKEKNIPCPLAAATGCPLMFQTQNSVIGHKNSAHNPQACCPQCGALIRHVVGHVYKQHLKVNASSERTTFSLAWATMRQWAVSLRPGSCSNISTSAVRGISDDKIWCPVCGMGVPSLAEHILDHELVSQEGRDAVKEVALEIERSLGFISTEESHIADTYDEEVEDTAGTKNTKNDFSPDINHKFTNEIEKQASFRGWPCPLAAVFKCKRTFKTRINAKTHAKEKHEDVVDGKFCMVPDCILGVKQLPLRPTEMASHMRRHRKKGHLNGSEDPTKTESQMKFSDRLGPFWLSRLFPLYLKDGVHEIEDIEDPFGQQNGKLEPSDKSLQSLWVSIAEGLGTFKVDKAYVRNANLEFFVMNPDTPFDRVREIGSYCIGPGIPHDLKLRHERCPNNEKITPDTSFFSLIDGVIKLHERCCSCRQQLLWVRRLHRRDLQQSIGQVHCLESTCLREIWNGTKYCFTHWRSLSERNGSTSIDDPNMLALRKVLSVKASQEWEHSNTFQHVISRLVDIQAGRMPASGLVCMDLEFNPLHHTVHEIAVCDLTTGVVRLDTRVDPNAKPWKKHSMNFSRHLTSRNFVKQKEQHAPLARTGQTTSIGQIAQELRQFMNPETVILTWHKDASDLTILRSFLEANEQDTKGLLPTNDQCFYMIPNFKQNLGRLPSGKAFPCALDILFPVFFPRHSLIGQNHRALPDTKQLRLMTLAFLDLIKPANDRQDIWKPPLVLMTASAQRSIKDYFQSMVIPISSLDVDDDEDQDLLLDLQDDIDLYISDEDESFSEVGSLGDADGPAENLIDEDGEDEFDVRAGHAEIPLRKHDIQSSIAKSFDKPKASYVVHVSSTSELGSKPVGGSSTPNHSLEGTGTKTRQSPRKEAQDLSTKQPTLKNFFPKAANILDDVLLGHEKQSDSDSKPAARSRTPRHSLKENSTKLRRSQRKHKAQALSDDQPTLTNFFSKAANISNGILIGHAERSGPASCLAESFDKSGDLSESPKERSLIPQHAHEGDMLVDAAVQCLRDGKKPFNTVAELAQIFTSEPVDWDVIMEAALKAAGFPSPTFRSTP